MFFEQTPAFLAGICFMLSIACLYKASHNRAHHKRAEAQQLRALNSVRNKIRRND